MIDVQNEPLIRLTEAARLAGPGRGNRPTHLSTILRWIMDGVKTPAGIIRLEAVRVGSRWMTSAAAVQRFIERLTPRLSDSPMSPPRTPRQRRLAAERAEKELERMGI